MKIVLVLLNDFVSYTVQTELPEQLIKAYSNVNIEALVLPNHLINQAI